ncbi:MAG: hypothetical protein ABI397_01875 [Candidatus Saccharimonas sp.]
MSENNSDKFEETTTLSRLSLSFEYDKTWSEVKRDTKGRTRA